jgi:hypothetical protein
MLVNSNPCWKAMLEEKDHFLGGSIPFRSRVPNALSPALDAGQGFWI